ncbi:MAG: alkaline phosphatase family protein [Bacteroidia bacterium]|nr:alkaline phosphatase family protein [Bacteroidia bacterium]
MIFRLYICGIFLLLWSTAIYSQNKKIPPEKPKLIIGIVVEQMRYDYLYRFWDKLEEKGFKRLMYEGTSFKNANINYLFTQSAPGIASIYTGTTPSFHGIVSDEWYLRLKGEKIYCVDDPNYKTAGGKTDDGKKSPKQMLTSTLGDEIKLFTTGKSKVIGVALDDRSSILAAGHAADASYWFEEKSGNWITSTYYMEELPKWVKEFNNKKFSDVFTDKEWSTMLPIDQYKEALPDKNSFEIGFERNGTSFPYNIKTIKEKMQSYRVMKHIPFGNTFTTDFAVHAIVNENLGKDDYTDLITISYSATNTIGLEFGPSSVEVEDTYLRLDRDIAHLLEVVDDLIGKENTLVFLTSNSGVAEVPKYLDSLKVASGNFKNFYALALLKTYLNALYGKGDWVLGYLEQQIYLNHNLIEDAKISLEDIQNKTSQFLLQFTGVSNTITATTLQTTHFTKGIFEKMQNSYQQKRSGDVMINLTSGWIEDISTATSHNSGYSYDTHVPLIFYGWKIGRNSIARPVNITDIAPTISTIMNISFPNSCTGEPILEMINNK